MSLFNVFTATRNGMQDCGKQRDNLPNSVPLMQTLTVTLFRALCRELNALRALYPSVDRIAIRKPITSNIGASDPNPTTGAEGLLEAVEQVVPGLEVPPQHSPLTWPQLQQLIRDNFTANKAVRNSQVPPLTDQAFAALRALPEQAYLEACSATTAAEGVVVEATSCYSHQEPQPGRFPGAFAAAASPRLSGFSHADNLVSCFKYRIRITNTRQHPVKVLGRRWHIRNDDGRLEAVVQLSADNGVVGQQPVIAPGKCFQYCSAATLSHTGPEVPSGTMEGALLVDVYDTEGRESVQRVQVPVGPFRLAGPARKSRSRQQEQED